ncbi:MAG: DUF1489 family protein [Rhizobiaceae bacterium]
MALNIIKLCVGCDSIEDLIAWREEDAALKRRLGLPVEQYHTTRMRPKREADILDGGSLYWVIKANVQCRQKILDLRPVTGEDGISRCQIVLDHHVVPTQWQPRRAFQGWRYLDVKDAPADLKDGQKSLLAMPRALREELASLGLL